jgi:N-methylhydantoinase A
MKLDRQAAESAMDRIAARLGTEPLAAAAGAFRIVNAHMADLMRRASIDRGRDPREFVLFAYGGAGPLHIAYLARELGISKIYVPPFSTVFSAMGMLTGGVLHRAERSCVLRAPLSDDDAEKLAAMFAGLEEQLSGLFDREGIGAGSRRYERFVHMKYKLQPGSLAVPMNRSSDDCGRSLRADFEAQYTAIYGPNAAFRNSEVEIVRMHVEGTCDMAPPALSPRPLATSSEAGGARKGDRHVYWPEAASFMTTPIYDGARLQPGMRIEGPAIVERMGDSIVLPAFAEARVDAYENVVIALGHREERP